MVSDASHVEVVDSDEYFVECFWRDCFLYGFPGKGLVLVVWIIKDFCEFEDAGDSLGFVEGGDFEVLLRLCLGEERDDLIF